MVLAQLQSRPASSKFCCLSLFRPKVSWFKFLYFKIFIFKFNIYVHMLPEIHILYLGTFIVVVVVVGNFIAAAVSFSRFTNLVSFQQNGFSRSIKIVSFQHLILLERNQYDAWEAVVKESVYLLGKHYHYMLENYKSCATFIAKSFLSRTLVMWWTDRTPKQHPFHWPSKQKK